MYSRASLGMKNTINKMNRIVCQYMSLSLAKKPGSRNRRVMNPIIWIEKIRITAETTLLKILKMIEYELGTNSAAIKIESTSQIVSCE